MAAVIPASVHYANDEQYHTLRIVSIYADALRTVVVEPSNELSLRDSGGSLHLTGLNTICRYIAEHGKKGEQLLGCDDASKAQIAEWLSYKNTGLSPINEDKLLKISKHLLPKIFLVSNEATLADLCLYAALHQPVRCLPPAQVDRYCNLVRWFDHIQHAVDTESVFPKVDFSKPNLPSPPALVQAPAKAADGSSSKGGAAATGKAAEKSSKNGAEVSGAASKSKQHPSAKSPAKESLPADSQESVATAAPLRPSDAGKATTSDAKPDNKEASSSTKDAKQAKKEARKEARKEAEPKKADEASIDMLDIRVGQIVEIGNHPSADSLYVEQVDLGEGKPRQVVSGLRKHVTLEQMQKRRVVACTNLKPAKMRDVMSYGMVLCASNANKVTPLVPPEGAAPGDRIAISGYSNEPLPEINPKKKILEKLKPDMKTDASGNAIFKETLFTCQGLPLTSDVPQGWVG